MHQVFRLGLIVNKTELSLLLILVVATAGSQWKRICLIKLWKCKHYFKQIELCYFPSSFFLTKVSYGHFHSKGCNSEIWTFLSLVISKSYRIQRYFGIWVTYLGATLGSIDIFRDYFVKFWQAHKYPKCDPFGVHKIHRHFSKALHFFQEQWGLFLLCRMWS